MQNESGHVVESAVEARSGFLDRPVAVVLTISTVLAAALLALAYFGVVKF
jgi:hypothetical protein